MAIALGVGEASSTAFRAVKGRCRQSLRTREEAITAYSHLTVWRRPVRSTSVKIRRYEPRDARPLSELYVRSVEHVGRRHYSARQVAAWASLAPSPERLQALSTDGRTTLVAVDDADRPIAFGDLEGDGRIGFLYCAPEVVGQGVAAALCGELERIARQRGLTRLYAEASEAARRFFLKQGFVVTARRDFTIAGVPIHNYTVEKSLGQTGSADRQAARRLTDGA